MATTKQQLQNKIISTREDMSWLFVAYLGDGVTIIQTQEDQSSTGNGRSAFYDVQQVIDKVVAFELRHVDGSQNVLLDLETGAYRVNGTPLITHDQNFDPTNHQLQLIYYTETRVEQTISTETREVQAIKHYPSRYFVGWQTTVNGKNHKALLAVG